VFVGSVSCGVYQPYLVCVVFLGTLVSICRTLYCFCLLAYQGKDIVFRFIIVRFIIEYSSLRGFWPLGNNKNRTIFL
jgi:hypothetical protein